MTAPIKPLTFKVTVRVTELNSWSSLAEQEIEVPATVKPTIIGSLVSDIAESVVALAKAEQADKAKRQADLEAELGKDEAEGPSPAS